MDYDDLETQQIENLLQNYIHNLVQIWAAYQILMDRMHARGPEYSEGLVESLVEFEHGLSNVLDDITDTLTTVTGVDEPIPTEPVDDFEESVLRTLSSLDDFDIEALRLPDEPEDEPAPKRERYPMGKGASQKVSMSEWLINPED